MGKPLIKTINTPPRIACRWKSTHKKITGILDEMVLKRKILKDQNLTVNDRLLCENAFCELQLQLFHVLKTSILSEKNFLVDKGRALNGQLVTLRRSYTTSSLVLYTLAYLSFLTTLLRLHNQSIDSLP